MKARVQFMSIVAALALLLAACGGEAATPSEGGGDSGSASEDNAQAGECSELETVELGFPGLPPDFVQMVTPLSIELGFQEEQCIDLQLISVESGAAAFRAMAAGEFDGALSGSVSPILAFGEGLPARIFASPGALLDFQVVATGDIDTCEKVEGARVLTDGPGGLIHAFTEYFLSTCGVSIDDDVELIIGEPETAVAQISQDAIQVTSMHVDERIFAEDDLGVPLNVLGNAWDIAPEFHYASFSTHESVMDDPERRDRLVRVNAALLKTGRWLADPANRSEAVTVMSEVSEQPEAVIEEAYSAFGSSFPTSCAEALPTEAFQFLHDLQVDLGNLTNPYEVSELVDTSLCEEAEALLDSQG